MYRFSFILSYVLLLVSWQVSNGAKAPEKLSTNASIQSRFMKSESRSVINLMSMVWSQFSWSEIFCILKVCLPGTGNDLCHYGCYCGIGQKPHPPQNDIDQHCKDHDQCWEHMITIKNCSNGVWEHYQWDLIDGKIVCDETGLNSECELGFCECDKNIVNGLKTQLNVLGSDCPVDPGCPE